MRALLTPEIAPRMGIVLFRPGADLMTLFQRGRVLIETIPEHLKNMPTGELPPAEQPLIHDQALRLFLSNEKVIAAAGGVNSLEAWLMDGQGCQWPHGDYHHQALVTQRRNVGAIRLCWACDNSLREQTTDRIDALAMSNASAWLVEQVRHALGFDESHILTLPELCWWATRFGVLDALPESMARKALRLPEDPIVSVYRESDIVPVIAATEIVQKKAKAAGAAIMPQNHECLPAPQDSVLALSADPESPESFMLRPKRRRWVNEKYTRWVKSQPCEGCRRPADDPHHVIGHGMGGTATKAHDLFVFPLCRECHDKLHADVAAFEQKYGTQLELLFRFLDRALAIGVIVKA